ncbi:glycosyltransferase family 4 protein [Salinisphaera sp. T31B1]|uniref:glycosyltransferase family 4 protein n=1 Tax=Salinisphaera sp. T31B1 TaxID=727963 RepID=UPI0033425874
MSPVDNGRLTHINLARGFRGGERQTELLIRELAADDIRQRVILRAGEPLVERLADVPGLTRVPIGRPFVWHALGLRGQRLHAHDGKGAHFAYAAHRLSGCEYVITRRVDNRPSGSGSTRRMYLQAAKVVVLSQAIERVMTDYLPGLATARIPSAAGGFTVDRAAAAAIRAEFGGDYVVGHVGALDDSQKGQMDLIAAARQLYAEDAGWRFVLVGGGRDADRLRMAAGDCPAIHFAGHVDNVGDYLAAFDAFAFPSVHEGLGSTLIDAMHAGLPIVAAGVDGIPELVSHEVHGLLVAARAPDMLADALRRLRARPDRARAMAERAYEKSLAYTAAAMAERYRQLYTEIGWTRDERAAATTHRNRTRAGQ